MTRNSPADDFTANKIPLLPATKAKE